MENNLGLKIKKLRKTQGLTLAELSGKAGISTSFLSQIENGKQAPTVVTLKKIADALGSPLKDLFNLQQETPEYIRKCDDQALGGLQKIYKQINVLSGKFDGRIIDCFNLVMEPFFEQVEEHAHMGEEFYLVLNGILTVEIEGREFVVNKDHPFSIHSAAPAYEPWRRRPAVAGSLYSYIIIKGYEVFYDGSTEGTAFSYTRG